MRDENETMIKEKLDFFLEEKVQVHIMLKNKNFMNGVIISKRKDGVYIFKDRYLGEQFLFASDVYSVSKFEVVKK